MDRNKVNKDECGTEMVAEISANKGGCESAKNLELHTLPDMRKIYLNLYDIR